jgi:hypothetical protein
MKHLLNPTIIVLLFVLVRSADIAIGAGVARDLVRTIAYGFVAVLALIALVLALVVA